MICILCDEPRKASDEDALPRWVLKILRETEPGDFSQYRNGALVKSGPTPPKFITRRPCIDCNGWMNTRFEQPAQPILEPVVRDGTATTLGPIWQEFVARWLVKTTLMLRLANPNGDAFPDLEYRRLRAEGTASAAWTVWIGAKIHPEPSGVAADTGPEPVGVVGDAVAPDAAALFPRRYLPGSNGLTGSLRHLVFQCIYQPVGDDRAAGRLVDALIASGEPGWESNSREPAEPIAAVTRDVPLTQLWPQVRREVAWPGDRILTPAEFLALKASLIT